MTGTRNFTEHILARAAETPDREALVVLPDREGPAQPTPFSYRALDAAAKRLAGWLQDRGAAGERVLILHASRRQFAVSFLACLYAGAIAVPSAPPGGRRHHEARIAGIVKDATPCVALTDAAAAPDVSRLLAQYGYGHIPCLAADVVPQSAPWHEPDLDRDSIAFLQYTSGSTRDPRGVMVTHGNLLANQLTISQNLGTTSESVLGGWLPFHHDMGLVGQLLHPLWLGATSVLLSPESFVRRPTRWLEAISRHRISVSGAPDFGYELCVRAAERAPLPELDLSGWTTAVSGGEPIRPETLRDFSAAFAPSGFRSEALTSGYGLAEATLLVASGPCGPGREVDATALEQRGLCPPQADLPTRSLIPSGTVAGTGILIVGHDRGQVLPDGEVGEIWVRGDSVAPGYWRRPGESAQTFGGCTADGRRGFLRTGDLGAVEDGVLYVTGRVKDMIVVTGRNLYPQDMEQMVQQVSTLFGSASAFSVRGEDERVVFVQELRARSQYNVDLAELTAAVERCLHREFEVKVGAVLLVRPGTVRRTTSGKVERAAMRRLFLRGELPALHQTIKPELDALLAGSRR
ncbi:fatty acyl-AMP ligase [Streptacidiphilus cavernicola]|uniref:Fatty acyl-AMP ligase n=1 Tax=Streptacidiphilus cavernicola TaxID=3342716 RepID=A0ABV6VQZ0_9ACTN